MIHQFTENINTEFAENEAKILLDEHRENIRKQAEAMLSVSATDIAGMTCEDIQKLLFDFQVHQIELELQLDLQKEELARAHQELSETRKKFARLYNSGAMGYLTINRQDIIRHANVAAAQLLGCALEMLINRKLGEFIHPADKDHYYRFIHDLAINQANQILTVRLNCQPDNTSYPLCPGLKTADCSLESCKPNNQFTYVECQRAIYCTCFENNIQEICLTISNITEKKLGQESIACLNRKLEEKILKQDSALLESNLNLSNKLEELKRSQYQLREREARLNSIFASSADGIIIIDVFGNIVSANPAVTSIFGYGEMELIGHSINKLMSTEQNKKHGDDFQAYLRTKIPSIIGQIREVEGLSKNGSIVPIDLSVTEFSIQGVSYFTGILRDVSLRKMREQQDKQHLDELAHVTRLGLMGEMASGIAHEVNQPLTAIANYTQACLNFINTEQPDLLLLREVLNNTNQQALRAGQIIHRMREFVKSKTLRRSDIDINSVIPVCLGLCAADLKHDNITVILDLTNNLPVTSVDCVQIEQVLLNLIRNGIDALKSLPQETPPKLTIQTYLNDVGDLIVRVKDNGPGIDDTTKNKILMPFFSTKPQGMGMGLSISNSIIKAHGGILYFQSTPGKGTTFYFTLPIHSISNEH